MVPIWSVFACLNYATIPFVNLLVFSSNLAWPKAFSHLNGKKQMSYQFTKRTSSSVLKTTDLSPNLWQSFRTYYLQHDVHIFYRKQPNIRKSIRIKPGDSCINQLVITHEIFSIFDDNYEVRGVFLDISKAFDKVWHKGIIHKL